MSIVDTTTILHYCIAHYNSYIFIDGDIRYPMTHLEPLKLLAPAPAPASSSVGTSTEYVPKPVSRAPVPPASGQAPSPGPDYYPPSSGPDYYPPPAPVGQITLLDKYQ